MKKTKNDQHLAPPMTPTAKAILTQVASKLRRSGASVPVPVEASAPTIEGSMKSGLSIALCLVETELDTLAAAAPRDNPAHRALFSLPPIQASASTDVVVPELPPQKVVTGDAEIDAVLWLRQVISTGQAALIEKAREAATRIKTPLKEVESRYIDWIKKTHPRNLGALLSAFNFSDLDGLAAHAITKATRQHEAQARFGPGFAIFEETPAEHFCIEALKRVRKNKGGWGLDASQVDKRFDAHPEKQPGTLTDCIAELTYWRELYWLRSAVGNSGDTSDQVNAREDYVFRMMSRIPPRNPEEAAEVLLYLASNDGMDRAQTGSIMMNLVGAPEPYRPHEVGGADE